jgi:hypothetical protein
MRGVDEDFAPENARTRVDRPLRPVEALTVEGATHDQARLGQDMSVDYRGS